MIPYVKIRAPECQVCLGPDEGRYHSRCELGLGLNMRVLKSMSTVNLVQNHRTHEGNGEECPPERET